MQNKLRIVALLLIALCMDSQAASSVKEGLDAFQARRYTDALTILLPLANQGDNEAQRLIGEMCFNGQGMKPDKTAAVRWTELAAAGGNMIAQYNLGYLYERGEGVGQSLETAREWYTRAALRGYVPAQSKLGDLNAGTDRDRAIYWYDQARLGGDERAAKQFVLLSAERTAENRERARLEEESEKQEKQQAEARRLAQERAERQAQMEEANAPAFIPPTTSPFDGLARINRITQETLRQINHRQAHEQAQSARSPVSSTTPTPSRSSAARPTTSVAGPAAAASPRPARDAGSVRSAPDAAAQASAVEAQRREREAQERERQARERAAREQAAQEQAAKEAEQRAQRDHLAAMKQGIRLQAIQCLGGEGAYWVTGTLPGKNGNFCIDVSYEASCPGGRSVSRGMAKTFIGQSGCFGDAYKIEPKPDCPAQQVQVRVTDVTPGCHS